MQRHPIILALTFLCVGCIGPRVKDPVHYKFEAKKGAEIIVSVPGGIHINAKGPVTIETYGAGAYAAEVVVTEEVEPDEE